MNARLHNQVYFLIAALLLYGCSPGFSKKQAPTVLNGEIDVTGWDFERNGPIKLDGNWLFSWGQFLKPSSWDELKQKMPHKLTVPGRWHKSKYPDQNDEYLPGQGSATYAILIKGLPKSVTLGVSNGRPYGASKTIALTNEGEIVDVSVIGSPSPDPEYQIPLAYVDKITRLYTGYQDNPSTLQSMVLLLNVSNFHRAKGGLWSSVIIGDYESLVAEKEKTSQLAAFMTGILFIIGLFHLILFSQRRQEKSTLWFGLLNFAICLRLFSMGVAQSSGFNDSIQAYTILLKLEYLAMPLGILLFLFFLQSLVPGSIYRGIYLGLSIISIYFIALVLFTKPFYFAARIYLFYGLIALSILLILTNQVVNIIKEKPLAQTLFISTLLCALGALNDILQSEGVIQTAFILPYTITLFILLQAGLISHNSTKAYKDSANLSTKLKREIKEKEFLNEAASVGKYQDIESAVHAFFQLIKMNFNLNSLIYLRVEEGKRIKSVLFDHPSTMGNSFAEFRDSFDYQLDESIGSLFSTYVKQKPLYINKFIKPGTLNSRVDKLIVEHMKFQDFIQIPLVSDKEVIGMVIGCNYNAKMNLKRREVKLLDSACQRLAGLFRAFTLYESLKTEIKQKKELLRTNADLSEQRSIYNEMIGDLSTQYTESNKQLAAAKKEQERVSKELEEASFQLIQAEKLSGLGAMVSGIAHDINNPLNYIESARYEEEKKHELLQKHLMSFIPEGDEGDEFRENLVARFAELNELNAEIKTGVSRIIEISKSMRNASRSDTEKTSGVNLAQVIEEAIIITGHKLVPFQVTKKFPLTIETITCNRSQVGQVIMNFLSNAADSLNEYCETHSSYQGHIQIELEIKSQANENQSAQSVAIISVSDNGGGIPEEHRDKVLNAFFTTKKAGHGTGLGLAISSKVAEQHQGSVQVSKGLTNEKGGYGAKFSLEIKA